MQQLLSRRSLITHAIASQLPEGIIQELLASSASKQELFLKLYQSKSHSLFLMYMYLLPAVLSFHYGALNKWPKQFLFWGTGGGLLLWWLWDIIRLPRMVREDNRSIAMEIWEEVSSIGEGPAEGLF